ncbi:glycosyltransferase involved in cell wall biosynthesis [Bradyrhizobium sp. GM2.2]|uniref:glycosyltransferase family 2 protein n=1 Tax=unclassified Bradyrhizobium TaxID=2631580 RepID=UPI001FFAFEC5|nr:MULTISPECIES: glycosyltransferase [unclassified Bradyrhizobium]MCK1267972.1 glycosyltransferase [Bradyrhizobium sp. 84]MCK1369793.1 glycosyltransferase [Bradyrhizobium sp. 49]
MLDLALQKLVASSGSSPRILRPSRLALAPARVSVVVPCYNYGRFLPDCVKSILTQEGVDVDVIVVDDASTDESSRVAWRFADADSRVKLIRNDHNRGHIESYNIGFAQATGTYVFLLSADDVLVPGALARAAALMEMHPTIGFAYGWSVPFTSSLPPARTEAKRWAVWKGEEWVSALCRRGANVIRSSDALVRRSVLDKVGGYRKDLPHSGDLEWWLRAALVSDVGIVGGVDQIYYRLHGSNMSRVQYGTILANLEETKRAFDAALSEAQRSDLRRTAYQALARNALHFAIADFMSDLGGSRRVEAYKSFALQLYPEVADSREWAALERRQKAGIESAQRNPIFLGREHVRMFSAKLDWRIWRFTGM